MGGPTAVAAAVAAAAHTRLDLGVQFPSDWRSQGQICPRIGSAELIAPDCEKQVYSGLDGSKDSAALAPSS
eukprot:COSAG01_NODE_1318_length_10746_cov_96.891425_14_plen_71_part_00